MQAAFLLRLLNFIKKLKDVANEGGFGKSAVAELVLD